jgi:hypothetical protein
LFLIFESEERASNKSKAKYGHPPQRGGYVTPCGIHSHSLTSSALVYLGLKTAFQKTDIGPSVPFAISLPLFCSEVIRNGFSCSPRVPPDHV